MKPSKAIIAGAAVAGLLTGSAAVRAHAGSPPPTPPATGIFAYSLPSALNIDIEHETVTLPLPAYGCVLETGCRVGKQHLRAQSERRTRNCQRRASFFASRHRTGRERNPR